MSCRLWLSFVWAAAVWVSFNAQNVDTMGKKDVRITVDEYSDSLHVSWEQFNASAEVESFRVRLDPVSDGRYRRVYWAPPDDQGMTIRCLEPDTKYSLVLVVHYVSNSTGQGEDRSVAVTAQTRSVFQVPESHLMELWEQRDYILIGAGISLVLVLIVAAVIWCCCRLCPCARRRQGRADLTTDGKEERKKASLPSAEELNDLELGQDRYTAFDAGAPQRPPSVPQDPAPAPPPPSFWTAIRGNYFKKTKRRPLPDPDECTFVGEYGGCGNEEDLYQNECFGPVESRGEQPIYGNCQF